jgi:hypothetical protein
MFGGQFAFTILGTFPGLIYRLPESLLAEGLNKKVEMKKSLHVILEDEDILELMRILMDDDPEGALKFLKKHFKGKARDLLEGG